MFFWKIDDETIRCLIHKQEIDSMGFDLQTLNDDTEQMESFLNAIVQNSQNYIEWHTENGIQNYAAKALPADQFLITISCTFQDDVIDRNLDQIRRMKKALNIKITEERLKEIYSMSGEKKEQAFSNLARDLNEVCTGNAAKELAKEEEANIQEDTKTEKRRQLPGRELIFASFDEMLHFCSVLDESFYYTSTLFKEEDQYALLVDFEKCERDSDAVAFILMAEEYGAHCVEIGYDKAYLMEHGRILFEDNAIAMLHGMSVR